MKVQRAASQQLVEVSSKKRNPFLLQTLTLSGIIANHLDQTDCSEAKRDKQRRFLVVTPSEQWCTVHSLQWKTIFNFLDSRNYCQWKGEERGRGIREEEVVFRISIVENSNTNFSENEEGRAENEAKMKKKTSRMRRSRRRRSRRRKISLTD